MKVGQDQFKTTRDQLVILIPELKRTTEGGVAIPDSILKENARTRLTFYEVLSRGAEVKEVMPGDYVLVNRFTEFPNTLVAPDKEGFTVAVCREYDVVGYFESEK